MCSFSGAISVLFPIIFEILIIDVRCEERICRHQKHISTLFGSKVKAHYVAVAAISSGHCLIIMVAI